MREVLFSEALQKLWHRGQWGVAKVTDEDQMAPVPREKLRVPSPRILNLLDPKSRKSPGVIAVIAPRSVRILSGLAESAETKTHREHVSRSGLSGGLRLFRTLSSPARSIHSSLQLSQTEFSIKKNIIISRETVTSFVPTGFISREKTPRKSRN